MQKAICVLLFLVVILPAAASAQSTWARYDDAGSSERGASVSPTADGGFIVAGYTDAGAGSIDIWVVKYNSNVQIEWQRTYSGTSHDGVGVADAWILKVATGKRSHARFASDPGLRI